ncbi:MAG: DHH family phosphoesterase [Thermofilaceae archaeon]
MLGRLSKVSSLQAEAVEAVKRFASRAEEPVLIVTHVNADPDALASSILLNHLLKEMGFRDVDLAFPEGPSKLSRKIMDALNIRLKYVRKPGRRAYSAAAVVDATNGVQLSVFRPLVEQSALLLVIDHHVPPGELATRASFSLVREEPATTVLVYQAVEGLSVPLTGGLSTLALTGILFDSRRFIRATPETMRTVARLLELGGDYNLALSLLEEESPYAERVAKLKGALRSHVLNVGGFLVAVSEIGSYEASLARALISIGADLALVASARNGECRLSIRASRSFLEKTGISASRDLALAVARELGGEGGGHDAAGNYKGPCSTSEALRVTLTALASKLGVKPKALK